MKLIKPITNYFKAVWKQFKRDWRKYTTVKKYEADAEKIGKQYVFNHPNATDRMVRRHINREIKKKLKKENIKA